jgi:hypothetical protein
VKPEEHVVQTGVVGHQQPLVELHRRGDKPRVHELIAHVPRQEDQPFSADLTAVSILDETKVVDRADPESLGALRGFQSSWFDDVGLVGVQQAATGSQGESRCYQQDLVS